jgi:hypothetical protein
MSHILPLHVRLNLAKQAVDQNNSNAKARLMQLHSAFKTLGADMAAQAILTEVNRLDTSAGSILGEIIDEIVRDLRADRG